MKRMIISLSIILALFVFIFCISKSIDHFCDDSIEQIDQISTQYEGGNMEDAKNNLDQLQQSWSKEKNFLFFFVTYDYIYEVEESINQLELCIQIDPEEDEQAREDFETQKEELNSKLRYLDSSTSIHWSTIF